ncbi:unnamed protein product, partial [Prorocentrum cordatum]
MPFTRLPDVLQVFSAKLPALEPHVLTECTTTAVTDSTSQVCSCQLVSDFLPRSARVPCAPDAGPSGARSGCRGQSPRACCACRKKAVMHSSRSLSVAPCGQQPRRGCVCTPQQKAAEAPDLRRSSRAVSVDADPCRRPPL